MIWTFSALRRTTSMSRFIGTLTQLASTFAQAWMNLRCSGSFASKEIGCGARFGPDLRGERSEVDRVEGTLES